MGNHYSDMKSSLNCSHSIPKHLKLMSSSSALQPQFQRQKKKSSVEHKQKEHSARQAVTVPSLSDAFGEEETISIGSTTFHWVQGRRFYVNQGDKILPNDQLELDRLSVLNFILRWALKGYIVAPIQDDLLNGIDVLNIGFGPGLWSGHQIIDLALDYKNSKFTAVDIINLLPEDFQKTIFEKDPRRIYHSLSSPLDYPDISLKDIPHTTSDNNSTILDNLKFCQCNIVEANLPFKDNSFDFVKHQLGTTAFTVKDWIRIIKEIVRVTKPGGYIQLIEIDYHTFNLGPIGLQWEEQLIESTRVKKQLEPRMAIYIASLLKFVGLIDVTTKLVTIPIGSWGFDLGELWKKNLELFVDSTSPILSKVAGMTPTEYKEQWNNSMKESENNKPFSNLHTACGRKPLHPLDLDHLDWSLFPPFSNSLYTTIDLLK